VLLKTAQLYAPPPVLTAAIIVIALVGPLNYFRLFVLADPVAVAFLAASAYAMLRYLRAGTPGPLVAAGALAVCGGLTQTYAAIPFFAGAAIDGWAHARSRTRLTRSAIAIAVVAVLVVGGKVAWTSAIPHEVQPTTVGLLQLSLGMTRFYAHLWTFVYVPLLPVVVVAVAQWHRSGRPFAEEVGYLAATVVSFAALSFVYQASEARFTFIYQPLLLMLLLALASQQGTGATASTRARAAVTAGAVCSTVLVGLQLGFTPLTYWEPRLRTLAWDPGRSWVGQVWNAQPVDRLGLGVATSPVDYSQATIPERLGDYPRRVLADYVALRSHPRWHPDTGAEHER
jgi:hypothetical protein